MTLYEDFISDQQHTDERLRAIAQEIISDLAHPDAAPAPLLVSFIQPGLEHLYTLDWSTPYERDQVLAACRETLSDTGASGFVFTMPGEWREEQEDGTPADPIDAVLVICRSYSMDQTYVLLPGTITPWRLAFTLPNLDIDLITLPLRS